MVQPLDTPVLSPKFCFSPSALKEFLRSSRARIDDSISQNLNALVTPSQRGFDPHSTQSRQNAAATLNELVDADRCRRFREEVLFPTWQARTEVLEYCAHVARAEDPDDPDAVQRQIEAARDSKRVVNERVDPYSARFFPKEPRTQVLDQMIAGEQSVESIIRARSWNVVNERCGSMSGSWQDTFERWRRKKGTE